MLPTETLTSLAVSNMVLLSHQTEPTHFENLETLHLQKCNFNSSILVVSHTLTSLYLTSVVIIDGNLKSITEKYTKLETLSLVNMTGIDLSLLEPAKFNLKNLYIIDSYVNQSSNFEFENMFSLKLTRCIIDKSYVDKFSSTFKKLRRIVLIGDFTILKLLKRIPNTSITQVILRFEGEQKFHSDSEIEEGRQFLSSLNVSSDATEVSLYKLSNGSDWEVYALESAKDSSLLRDVLIYLYIITISVISLFGIFGSFVSGIVLSKKKLRSSTSCILLGLTLSDLTLLVTYLMSVVYFGLKLILIFLQFQISDSEYPFLWFTISVESAQRMELWQSRFLYSLNKTGNANKLNYVKLE